MSSYEFMGFRGKDPSELLRAMGFVERETVSDAGSHGDWAARLPSGWFLILGDSVWSKTALEQSAGCQAICMEASETAMSSWAALWEDGRELWKVARDDDPSTPEAVEARGDLPPQFHEIHASLLEKHRRAKAEDQEVDYLFNLPIDLAGAVTGYRADYKAPEGTVFARLERVASEPEPEPAPAPPPAAPRFAPPPERPWWKFW